MFVLLIACASLAILVGPFLLLRLARRQSQENDL